MARERRSDEGRRRRHARIRKVVVGLPGRPRLAIFRSARHIYAQVIDDDRGHCLASAATVEPWFRQITSRGSDVAAARAVGVKLAEKARSAGIETVVFDRNGYKYHGRIKALAEAVRESGIVF